MVFKCQEDSFLKQYSTKVVSCESATLEYLDAKNGTAEQLKGFDVICENTILYPEGGGQPWDTGKINGCPVLKVIKKGSLAVHFVETTQAFAEGSEVVQLLDWDRRLDHMQQHSGQHLISALFEKEFNYNTTSWWLGSETSYIELDTNHVISRESMDTIEQKANELIRENRSIKVTEVEREAAQELLDIRASKELPKDHKGLVRIVQIEGIESNMCCGTHVTNLYQLQCIKILYAEKSKGNVLVHFVIGNRVMQRLGECFQREQLLNSVLKGGPKQHIDLITKLQNNVKNGKKAFQKLTKEIAMIEAEKVENMSPSLPKYYCLHRKDGIEPEFISTFLRSAPENILYFLTVSENSPNGNGHFALRGDTKTVKKFGALFIDILDGKGNGKDNYFQAKFANVNRIQECEALLKEYYKNV